MNSFKGRVYVNGALLEVGLGITPNGAAGAVVASNDSLVRLPRRFRITLTNFVIPVAAADDFGSLKLCDLPNTNLKIIGCVVDLTGVCAGFTTNTGATVDLALGTVATTSTAFSNAGEKNLVAKIDGTGAGTTSTIKGASAAAETDVLIAAGGTNAVYVNISDPCTVPATLTLSGTIDIHYEDLGKTS